MSDTPSTRTTIRLRDWPDWRRIKRDGRKKLLAGGVDRRFAFGRRWWQLW